MYGFLLLVTAPLGRGQGRYNIMNLKNPASKTCSEILEKSPWFQCSSGEVSPGFLAWFRYFLGSVLELWSHLKFPHEILQKGQTNCWETGPNLQEISLSRREGHVWSIHCLPVRTQLNNMIKLWLSRVYPNFLDHNFLNVQLCQKMSTHLQTCMLTSIKRALCWYCWVEMRMFIFISTLMQPWYSLDNHSQATLISSSLSLGMD